MNSFLDQLPLVFHGEIPDAYREKLRYEVAALNFSRAYVFSVLLFIVHIPLIIIDLHHAAQGEWNNASGYRNLFIMHLVLIIGNLSFIALAWLLKPATPSNFTTLHQVTGTAFAFFILLWGSAVSGVDQEIHGQITVYVMVAFAVSVGTEHSLKTSVVLYAAAHGLFWVVISVFQPSVDIRLGHYINGTALALIAWTLSRLVYGNRVRDLINREKRDELQGLVEERNAQLEKTLADLKGAQMQLVHAEKMALLGELTAGIAHEIQNPLNFVNNFAELSIELCEELKEKNVADRGETQSLVESIERNLSKVVQHGERAANIVKGMLTHAGSGNGRQEPTDLNLLLKEFLDIAFHSYRAKDPTITVRVVSELDPNLPTLAVAPEEISRVFLNLLTNAFYAVTEKAKRIGTDFSPEITIKTIDKGNRVEIQICDNGDGVPESLHEKIFQPFFTTKPVGQGTGLGLSISRDIARAHSGDLYFETKQGEFAKFIVALPKTR
jgi:signal transduction histidine kinase